MLCQMMQMLAALFTPAAAEPPAAQPIGPSLFEPAALGQSGRITFSPGFSPDGQTLYFTRANCKRIWNCPQLLYSARRVDGQWQEAKPVALPQRARAEWPSVTPDGQRLLFSWSPQRPRHKDRNVDNDFDLFSLDLTKPNATPVALDDPDINRIRGGRVRTLRFVNNETAPVLTEDGDLYFWTERLDGVGLRDIYVAKGDSNGGFRAPRPLSAPINSTGEDDGSWIAPNGRLIIASFERRNEIGGGDLSVSVKTSEGWSDPVNLGKSVNSRFADFAGRITPDGRMLVFTSARPRSPGGESGLFQVWQIPVSQVPVLEAAIARSSD